jgi:hypothetical protein
MTATFYFSGVDRAEHLSLLAQEHAAGMINANVVLQPSLYKAYMSTYMSVPLVLDSGAFQGNSDIVAYADLLEQIGHRFQWVSNLDAIMQPAIGDRNFSYLQDHLSPALRDKVLWIYQPGGSFVDMICFARSRGIIGIGGLVALLKQRGIQSVLIHLFTIGNILRDIGAKAHVFGISSPQILFQIRSEPWLASIDSSKWIKAAYQAGEVVREDGTHQVNVRNLGLRLTPREIAANNVRVMRFWLLPRRVLQTLLLDMEEEVVVEEMQPEEVLKKHRYEVMLQGLFSLQTFTVRFRDSINTWCSEGEDENQDYIGLLGYPSLENELFDWCEDAMCKGLITDYTICEEYEEITFIAA